MAKQQSILPEKIAKQKKCPLCECFFVPDKPERFRCEGCEPVLGGPLNPAVRQLAEDLEKQDKAESVVEKDIPTRSEVEMMIRVIVKEELAAMKDEPKLVVIGPSIEPKSDTRTATYDGEKLQIDTKTAFAKRVFKPKNCIKCGNSFTPRVGFQKICDNCRAKGDK